MSCQCCRNPFGVCHNNHECACHPQQTFAPPAKPPTITTSEVRHIMRGNR